MSFKNVIISVLLAIILTWFALVNSTTVTISLIFRSYTLSLSLVILVSILIGVILTGIISAAEQARMLRRIGELEGNLKKEEQILGKEKKAK